MTSKPSLTNSPRTFARRMVEYTLSRKREEIVLQGLSDMSPYSGGYSVGVPPLPIPNREVKPVRADGTAHPWESR